MRGRPGPVLSHAALAVSLAALLLGAPAARAADLAACANADPAASRPVIAASGPPGIEIAVEPVALGEAEFPGARLAGAWVLRAPVEAFGGFSGLELEPATGEAGAAASESPATDRRFMLTAISDTGALLTARVSRAGPDLRFEAARLVPLREADGVRPSKSRGDAEALVRLGPCLIAAFERQHRLAPIAPDGTMGPGLPLDVFEINERNAGVEALALAGGTILALVEGRMPEGAPVLAIDPEGEILARGHLDVELPHLVTGAAIGPDGALYTVWRHFSVLTGVSIRVRRHRLEGTPPMPEAGPGTLLAAFETASGIDNMEAISFLPAADGAPRLWLLSDDNFNPLQRTLVVELVLEP